MGKYIKSELFKVTRRTYPFVLLTICTIIGILINVGAWYALNYTGIKNYNFSIEGIDILNAGLYVRATIIWYMIIFTTDIGFSGEWRNGTMKNKVSFGISRNSIFVGKTIINSIILLVGLAVVSGAYILTNYLCFKNDGSLTAAAYSEYFYRYLIMLPLIFAGQSMATSLCLFFSTDLLWVGLYAVVITMIPSGLMIVGDFFDIPACTIAYEHMPTTVLTRLSWGDLTGMVKRALKVAAVTCVLPFSISLLVFNKKEIK